jgi:hypothetical protein
MGATRFAVVPVLSLALWAHAADEPLSKGDSTLTRSQVNVGLHVPASLAEPHGPAGVLIYFGGLRDDVSDYLRPLGMVGDALDLVVMVPQMPWFTDAGKVQPAGIYPVLGRMVDDATKQLGLGQPWLMIGGASAGGTPAHELARKWSSKVDLFLLSSAGPFPDVGGPRTLHVVAEGEVNRLGPQGHRGVVLGQGKKDMFAIPGSRHGAHFKHLRAWLETEVSALRLAEAAKTVRLAEEKIAKGEADTASGILKSTMAAVDLLGQPMGGADALFQYEAKRRQELLQRNGATLKLLEDVKVKLSTPRAAATGPSQVP